MSSRIMLAGFLCVAALSGVTSSRASAPPEANPSVTWRYTMAGEDAGVPAKIDALLASARAARRPVMIDFSAEWCAACRLLDRDTLTSADVIRQARRFVTVRIDATNAGDVPESLAGRFGVRVLPTVVFVSSAGSTLPSSSILGFVDASTLAGELRKIP